MAMLPTVKFGDTTVTRLISGGNPLCANSHFSRKMDGDMLDYFTDEQIVAYLHDLERGGIDTLQARGDYHRVLHWLELHRREGGRLKWIAQTASEMSDVFQNIRIIAAAGAMAIYHHGSQTDTMWNEGRIDDVLDYLRCMRDCGVRVGLGTHIPEVIEYAEDKGWDVDFYMAGLYNISRTPRHSQLVTGKAPDNEGDRFIDEDPAKMCEVIRATDKTCLAFKILGAARRCASQDDVQQAFRFALANIKPIDAIVVGMFPKYADQISLNVQYTIDACEALPGR